jgi:hypothetical protein
MADLLMYNVSQKVKSVPPYLYQNVLETEMIITGYHITDLCCDFRHNRSKNNDTKKLEMHCKQWKGHNSVSLVTYTRKMLLFDNKILDISSFKMIIGP